MTNKLTERNNNDNDDDDLDLLELLGHFINFLFRRKKEIIAVTILTTAIFLGLAVNKINNTHNKHGIELNLKNIISQDYLAKANIHFIWTSLEDILKNDELIEKIFSNEKVLEIYTGNGTMADKRDFLEDNIEIKWGLVDNEKDKITRGKATLILDFKGRMDITQIITGAIIMEYSQRNFVDFYAQLDSKKGFVESELKRLEQELAEQTLQIQGIMTKEFGGNYQEVDVEKIINMKYGDIYFNYNMIKGQYQKYATEHLGYEGLLKEKEFARVLSVIGSHYEIKQKSGATKIVLLGVILGIILGILVGILKDCNDKFRKKD